MDELIAFVTARLDEDEAAANAAARGIRIEITGSIYPGQAKAVREAFQLGAHDPTHVHLTPARVLREVAAKRAIVAEVRSVGRLRKLTTGGEDRYRDWLLRQLAAVYSDHPDYRPWWAL